MDLSAKLVWIEGSIDYVSSILFAT